MEMQFRFAGEGQIEATLKDARMTISDNAEDGAGTVKMEPLDLFFASIGLCAGKYIMAFCRPRDIPYEETRISLSTHWEEEKKMHTRVMLQIHLPQEFPDKYKKALLRAVDLCSVKKHILDPPSFHVEATVTPRTS